METWGAEVVQVAVLGKSLAPMPKVARRAIAKIFGLYVGNFTTLSEVSRMKGRQKTVC